MKNIKYLIIVITFVLSSLLSAYKGGVSGYTLKTNSAGCGACHSTHSSPSSIVVVQISGPASLTPGQKAQYQLIISGGSGTKVSCNIAASTGTLSIFDSNLKVSNGELTHPSTRSYSGGSYTYNFYYTAPATAGTQTLYATGLSTKTAWNFASNFSVTVANAGIQPITAPTNLQSGVVNPKIPSVQLNWTDNANNETAYKVERKEEPAGSFSQIASLAANTVTYGDSVGLQNIKSYTYRIFATNADTFSNYSNTYTVNIPKYVTPVALPSSLQRELINPQFPVIRLSWTDNSTNETGFDIERKEEPKGSYILLSTLGANSTSFTDSGNSLATQKSYTYRIQAKNTDTSSGYTYSSTINIPKYILPISAPTSLSYQIIRSNPGKVNLSWTANAINATEQVLQKRMDKVGGFGDIALLGSGVNSFSDTTGLIENHLFEYRVFARNTDTVSAFSNTIEFVLIPTSVRQGPGIPSEFNLNQNYPNPFNPETVINYSVQNDVQVKISVYDALGKEVAMLVNQYQLAGNYSISFDAAKLNSGVYYYKMEAGNFTSIKKMTLVK